MAELEVAKHGKNVVHIMAKDDGSLMHRLREIALEIVIIVFAVSISIWFHSVSEHRHEQKQVRTFLLGLKADLARDIDQLDDIAKHYRQSDANLQYLLSIDGKAMPDPAKFNAAFDAADHNYFFTPENSRFEGFKSSGRMTNIEDEQLLSDILTLYQVLYPQIEASEGGWSTGQKKLRAHFDQELENGEELAQRLHAISTPKAKRLLKRMVATPQLYQRYKQYTILAGKIVQGIDAAYPPKAN